MNRFCAWMCYANIVNLKTNNSSVKPWTTDKDIAKFGFSSFGNFSPVQFLLCFLFSSADIYQMWKCNYEYKVKFIILDPHLHVQFLGVFSCSELLVLGSKCVFLFKTRALFLYFCTTCTMFSRCLACCQYSE